MVPNAKSKILFAGSGTYTCSCRVLCILWATRYPVLIQELCSADAAKTYEESNAFANAVANANYHILDEINIRPYMIQMENMTRIRS